MYICEGCGAEFNGSPEDAFYAGWDTPERFGQHTTCNTCPITMTAWWRVVAEGKRPSSTEAELLNKNMSIYLEHNDRQ